MSLSSVRSILLTFAGCLVAGMICFGDLDKNEDNGLVSDEIYAVSIYLETTSWCHLLQFMRSPRSVSVNSIFLLPSSLQAFCRAAYWIAAYSETDVIEPIRLQAQFHWVLIACHIVMGLLNTWMSVFCIRHFTATVPLVGGRDV